MLRESCPELKKELTKKFNQGFNKIARGNGGKVGLVEQTNLTIVYHPEGIIGTYEWMRQKNGTTMFCSDEFDNISEFMQYATQRKVTLGPIGNLEVYLKYLD